MITLNDISLWIVSYLVSRKVTNCNNLNIQDAILFIVDGYRGIRRGATGSRVYFDIFLFVYSFALSRL